MKALFLTLFLLSLTKQVLACTPMSKDPRCWESCHPLPRFPSERLCLPQTEESKITHIIETTGRSAKARFSCKGENEKTFDCSQLVDLYGKNLIGLEVQIVTNFNLISDPGCHIIGGCKKCVPSFSYGKIKE